MFLDLDKLPPEGEAFDRTLDAGRLSVDDEEFRLVSDVALKGKIQRIDALASDESGGPEGAPAGTYRLVGSMSCRIEVACVRCLEPFSMHVQEALDLLYLPQVENVGHASVKSAKPGEPGGEPRGRRHGGSHRAEDAEGRGLDDEELAVAYYENDRIDLAHMVLEQIILALPMKPLCKPDCLGLCPECGANRNTTACTCAPEQTDPRWATLKTLLGR